MEDCNIKIILNGDSMSGTGGFIINNNCKDKENANELLQNIHEKLHELYYLFKV